jgi:hypothetical protein
MISQFFERESDGEGCSTKNRLNAKHFERDKDYGVL